MVVILVVHTHYFCHQKYNSFCTGQRGVAVGLKSNHKSGSKMTIVVPAEYSYQVRNKLSFYHK